MLLAEMADYLSTNGIGTQGTDLFYGFMPDTPNTAVALYETGGLSAAHGMAPSPGLAKAERPRLQVVARSTDYDVARLKIDAVWKLLDGLGDVVISGTRYLGVYAVSSPYPMGRDAEGRAFLTCNFDVTKSLSTS